MAEQARLIVEIPSYLKRELRIRLRDLHKFPVSVKFLMENIMDALINLRLADFDVLLDNPYKYTYEALTAYLPSKHTDENVREYCGNPDA